jgi:hypothetical protein
MPLVPCQPQAFRTPVSAGPVTRATRSSGAKGGR